MGIWCIGMKVSVVMPAYNAEKYIKAAVQSVLNQTWTEFELLVIDDGSRDSTVEIVKGLMAEDHRIRLLENPENAGVSASRNLGVQQARGEWIAFLDSDDLWREDKLERQFSLGGLTGVDLIYSAAQCISEEGYVLDREFQVPVCVDYQSILRKNDLICSSVLLRRELALRFPFPVDQTLHEDYICWTNVLKNGCRAAGVPLPLVLYRIRKGSKSYNKIRSAGMMLRSYQFLELPISTRAVCFFHYALHGLSRHF